MQCTSCDAPAGIVEFTNIGYGIEELEKKVAGLMNSVANIDQNIVRLANMLQRLGR